MSDSRAVQVTSIFLPPFPLEIYWIVLTRKPLNTDWKNHFHPSLFGGRDEIRLTQDFDVRCPYFLFSIRKKVRDICRHIISEWGGGDSPSLILIFGVKPFVGVPNTILYLSPVFCSIRQPSGGQNENPPSGSVCLLHTS